MAAAQSASKIAQLFRQGCVEIPDVMFGLGLTIIGLNVAGLAMYKHHKREVKRPFKQNYIVKRDDDPDAARYLRFHQNPTY